MEIHVFLRSYVMGARAAVGVLQEGNPVLVMWGKLPAFPYREAFPYWEAHAALWHFVMECKPEVYPS